MANTVELKEQRKGLIEKARERLDAAGAAEVRALSDEDKSVVDKVMADVASLDELIDRLEAIEDADSEEDAPKVEVNADKGERSFRKSRPLPVETRGGGGDPRSSKEYRRAYGNWMRTGDRSEFRDVTVSPVTSGGNLIAPVQVSEDITKQVTNLVFLRKLARVMTLNSAAAIGVRQLTTRMADIAFTSEIGALTPDTTMAFGQRLLTPNLVAKLVTVSIKMIELSSDIEGLVNEELAIKFSYAEENGYMNGSGVNQPLGAFVASANGIPTTQDYVGSNTTTAMTADSIIGAKYALKQPYLASDKAAWVFSRPAIQQIRLLKDTMNRYLLVDGGGLGAAPDTILGIPYFVSEFAPSTFTTGSYVGILGNWDYYRIAQVRDLEVQRLVERYADLNEVGFIGRRFVDGAPVLGEAFVRLKLA